jgi:hypothetical protein
MRVICNVTMSSYILYLFIGVITLSYYVKDVNYYAIVGEMAKKGRCIFFV